LQLTGKVLLKLDSNSSFLLEYGRYHVCYFYAVSAYRYVVFYFNPNKIKK